METVHGDATTRRSSCGSFSCNCVCLRSRRYRVVEQSIYLNMNKQRVWIGEDWSQVIRLLIAKRLQRCHVQKDTIFGAVPPDFDATIGWGDGLSRAVLPVDQALHVDGLDPDFLKSSRKTTHLDAILKASIWRILCKHSVYYLLLPKQATCKSCRERSESSRKSWMSLIYDPTVECKDLFAVFVRSGICGDLNPKL